MGGPNGGDGGKGGDVWLVADRNVASLLAFRDHPHRRAASGTHGQGKRKHGASGDDLVVHVPEGTVVHDFDGEVLADLLRHGDRWRAGGRGAAVDRPRARRSSRHRSTSRPTRSSTWSTSMPVVSTRIASGAAGLGAPNGGGGSRSSMTFAGSVRPSSSITPCCKRRNLRASGTPSTCTR